MRTKPHQLNQLNRLLMDRIVSTNCEKIIKKENQNQPEPKAEDLILLNKYAKRIYYYPEFGFFLLMQQDFLPELMLKLLFKNACT